MTVFGSCRDEAINNLAAELAARRGLEIARVVAPPLHEASAVAKALADRPAGKEGSGQLATKRKSDAVN
jgi:hypothetical protein